MQRLCQPLRCSYVCIDHTSRQRIVSFVYLCRFSRDHLDRNYQLKLSIGDRPKNRKQTLRSSHLYRLKTYRSRISRSLTRGMENCCVARTRAHAPMNTRETSRNLLKTEKMSRRNYLRLESRVSSFHRSNVCMYTTCVNCYCLFISTANISSFYTTYTHASMYEMSNE